MHRPWFRYHCHQTRTLYGTYQTGVLHHWIVLFFQYFIRFFFSSCVLFVFLSLSHSSFSFLPSCKYCTHIYIHIRMCSLVRFVAVICSRCFCQIVCVKRSCNVEGYDFDFWLFTLIFRRSIVNKLIHHNLRDIYTQFFSIKKS